MQNTFTKVLFFERSFPPSSGKSTKLCRERTKLPDECIMEREVMKKALFYKKKPCRMLRVGTVWRGL